MTITIDQAIDRNIELKAELIKEGRLEKADAVQLGIETLKREQHRRKYDIHLPVELLPGETKD